MQKKSIGHIPESKYKQTAKEYLKLKQDVCG